MRKNIIPHAKLGLNLHAITCVPYQLKSASLMILLLFATHSYNTADEILLLKILTPPPEDEHWPDILICYRNLDNGSYLLAEPS